MRKLSSLAVSTLLALTLFAPVGCFAEQQKSSDCCGCLGDHGGYYCDNGQCVDGSKAHTKSLPPSSSWPSTGSSGEADADAETHDAGAPPRPCLSFQECNVDETCTDGVCR